MFQYVEAPVQEATLEDLLGAPYTTEGTWEIYEVFSMYHNGAGMDEAGTEPEPNTTVYAFASSDPELIEKLETFTFERTQN